MKSFRSNLFVGALVWCVGVAFGGGVEAEELFADLGFEQGFQLSTVRSSMKPNELGVVLTEVEGAKPRWRLAQWGTRFGLQVDSVREDVGETRVLENEGKKVSVHRGGFLGEGVTLEVKGAAEYDGKLRAKGEAWPHVLLGQAMPKSFRMAHYEALKFHLEFRVNHCENTTGLTLTRNLHTAQITAFFAIRNANQKSDDLNDMIWFGLPLFDARFDVPRGHQAVDNGQADATGKFICTLKGERFWDGPTGDGKWKTLDCDLVPLLKEALVASQAKGFLTDTKFEDLVGSSFNLGWEVPGPYDCAVSLRGLSLLGE